MKKCPNCNSERTAREKRPDSYTVCFNCGTRMLSTEWDKERKKKEKEWEVSVHLTWAFYKTFTVTGVDEDEAIEKAEGLAWKITLDEIDTDHSPPKPSNVEADDVEEA